MNVIHLPSEPSVETSCNGHFKLVSCLTDRKGGGGKDVLKQWYSTLCVYVFFFLAYPHM
jgi:hypothetical protein